MNRRFLGNSLILIFMILFLSGGLMYFIPLGKKMAALHTLFALLFVLGILFHLLNNRIPLLDYFFGRGKRVFAKFQGVFLFSIVLLLAVGAYLDLPLVNSVYHWGNQYRNQQSGKTEQTFEYQVVELNQKRGNHEVRVELKKGAAFKYPLFAIWVEDSIGNYIETLYISKALASGRFGKGKKIGGKSVAPLLRRPEALPYWAHKRGIKAPDGLYVPLGSAPDLDVVSGATPTNNFIVKTQSNFGQLKDFRILMEVNQSFDWNDYYTKDKYPRDSIYTGSGKVGQPAVVYCANVNELSLSAKSDFIMELIGHSHHSGQDGTLYTDLNHISSARKIADRIIVSVK